MNDDKKPNPLIAKMLEALDVAGNTHTLADTVEKIKTGELILFVGTNAILIVEINQYPQKRVLNCFMAAGDMDEIIFDLMPKAEAKAIEEDCDYLVSTGRMGWDRILPKHGWTRRWSTLTKGLK